jgi:RNA polymerase sigma-70 factor (ECF subfamily)
MIYLELRRLARRHMRRERPDHTLQPTALVHEAYLRLVQRPDAAYESRAHFLAVASHVMRHILIDYARRRSREKRGAGLIVTGLQDDLSISPEKSLELIQLDDALRRLSQLDARQGQIVELRYFGGMTVEEAAHILGISPKTVKREWSMAKAWLRANLAGHVNGTRTLGRS